MRILIRCLLVLLLQVLRFLYGCEAPRQGPAEAACLPAPAGNGAAGIDTPDHPG